METEPRYLHHRNKLLPERLFRYRNLLEAKPTYRNEESEIFEFVEAMPLPPWRPAPDPGGAPFVFGFVA